MSMKKILAGCAASVLTVAAFSVSAFADQAGPSKDFTVDVNASATDGKLAIAYADVPAGTTAIKYEISFDEGAWGGGAIGRNVGGNWTQDDTKYSNEDAASLTQTINFTEIDADSDIEIQCWWVGGGAMHVKTTYVGAGAATAAEPDPATGGDTDAAKPAPDTGVEGVAAVLGVAVIAGGALIVAKKKR